MKQNIVAVEGLVHAGKTTIMHKVAKSVKNVRCIEEYIYFATKEFPNFPCDLGCANRARMFFRDIEEKRKNLILENDSLVVCDRSILSILAYHFAVERITEGRIKCFLESSYTFRNEGWIIPHICIYLDVSDFEILERHAKERGGYQPILLNSHFNKYQRAFYEMVITKIFPNLKIIKIDADNEIETVFSDFIKVLKNI